MPAVAPGLCWLAAGRWRRGLAAIALAWSIAVAATGAFCYPNDRWNTHPVDVDLNHQRLWDWHDLQITRCWRHGMSPQNFGLLE